jgi:hypothetical protein
MKVKAIAAAGVDIINDNVCPECLLINITAGAVTRVRVNVAGVGYICDLNTKAIQALTANAMMHTPLVADIGKKLLIPLADGYRPNKRTEIEITTTGATVTATVYYLNTDKGSFFIKSERQKAFANQPLSIEKFTQCTIIANGLDEQVNVRYMNGSQHTGTIFEYQMLNTRQSAQNLLDSSICVLDNDEQFIKSVEFIASADTEVFVTSFMFDDMDEVERKLVSMAEKSQPMQADAGKVKVAKEMNR